MTGRVRPRGVRPSHGTRRARHARLAWFVRAAQDGDGSGATAPTRP